MIFLRKCLIFDIKIYFIYLFIFRAKTNYSTLLASMSAVSASFLSSGWAVQCSVEVSGGKLLLRSLHFAEKLGTKVIKALQSHCTLVKHKANKKCKPQMLSNSHYCSSSGSIASSSSATHYCNFYQPAHLLYSNVKELWINSNTWSASIYGPLSFKSVLLFLA